MNQEPLNGLWDSFWAIHATSEDLFHYLLWRIRFLFSKAYAGHLAREKGRAGSLNLLEVGCGSARTLHFLDQKYSNSRCFAFDLSPKAIQVVRSISPKFHPSIANAFNIPLESDQIDICFSIGLIEHFTREDAAKITSEKIRVTKPGGIVGIMVPWRNSVYNLIVRKAFGRHWPFGDENPFRRRELTIFMENLGLKGTKIKVIYGSTLLGIGRKD